MELLRTGTEWFPADDPSATGAVRRAAVRLASQIGLPESRAAEVGIVASEVTLNVQRHAQHGVIGLQVALRDGRPGVQIVAVDHGPGMADLPLAARDGHSSVGTLGVGLGGIGRLSSALDIDTHVGKGTVLVADLWPRPDPPPAPLDIGAVTRPISGEDVCGDTVAGRVVGGCVLVAVCDGLGHGPLAMAAAREAVDVFHRTNDVEPAAVLKVMHDRLSHTRGAAVAVAAIDISASSLRFAGVGNIAAVIDAHERRQAAPSQPGIVGHRLPSVRQLEFDLAEDAVLVMHSDGVRDAWNLTRLPGLRRRSATVIAASVLRDAGSRPDDASVLAARRHR